MSAPAAEAKVSPAPAATSLAGKVAVVTGSSRGIGQYAALRLAREGAKLIINYNSDAKSAQAVVDAIVGAGGAATAVQADVSNSAHVDRLFAEAKRIYGRVDIAVANAGIVAGATIAETTDADFDKVFNINVKGVFYVLRAAAKTVESGGRIIVIGSILKNGHTPGIGAYAATKSAVETLATTLAQELGAKAITVNTIHPGPVDTDLLRAFGAEALKYYATLSPQKRLGSVADLGDAIGLLASEGARWITGQAIVVAGGAK